MTDSRAKGARAERAWATWLRENLNCPQARRGRQYSGSPDSPDVTCGVPGTHPEVKHVERLNLYDAISQACRDSGEDSIPYVAHRRNRTGWLVTCRAEDWLRLSRLIVATNEGKDIGKGDLTARD
jgi:hypothetical protein